MEKTAFFPAAKIYYYILMKNLKTAFFGNKKGTVLKSALIHFFNANCYGFMVQET